MWTRTRAEVCASYLKEHGTVKNATGIIVHNFGGRFLGYVGVSPDYIMWRYSFRDSFLSLRFHRDLQEEQRVEIFVGNKSVAVI